MMKQQVLGIIAVVALSSTIASAELVGSLHLATGQATNGFYSLAGLVTRTGDGDVETRGTVQGEFSLLPGSDTNNLPASEIKVWSSTTVILDLDRYQPGPPTGIAVWDFDLTGMSTNAWELKVDATGRRAGDSGVDEWFISINGLGRTLDTTDISTLSRGDGYDLVSDVSKYIKIGDMPVGVAVGTNTWNVTDIIEAAITNGGKVRLVYSCDGFKDDITFNNDSGLIAADSATGISVNNPMYISDDFETGSGEVPMNGWTEGGPEPKEYNNPTNEPGVLNVRDHNADERDDGAVHAGYFDTINYVLEGGVTLAEANDWFRLQMDLGIYQDDSGAELPTGRGLRLSFTDSNAPSNAGFGFLLQTSTNSAWSELHEFDTATAYGPNLDGAFYAHPFDGTLAPLFMKVTKVAGGYDIDAAWGGSAFDIVTVSNSLAETFDTLIITAGGYDFAFKMDNVYLAANVDPTFLTPYEKWYTLYGLEGSNTLYSADPDGDLYDNMYEWGLGGDPTNELDQGIASVYGGEGSIFTYTFPSNSLADDLNYYIETTENLVTGTWTNTGYDVTGTGIHSENASFAAVTNELSTVVKDEQFIKLIIEQK